MLGLRFVPNREGRVSHFAFPEGYLANCIHKDGKRR